MSGQLESRHFFRAGDTVQHRDGRWGRVVEALALYAMVEWDDLSRQEIDQFEPLVEVVERAEAV